MNQTYARQLRELAREMLLPVSVVEMGLECGLFVADEPLSAHERTLRQIRRIMRDLDVNPPGVVLILRLVREVERLQASQVRSSAAARFEAEVEEWLEGIWRELKD